MSKPFRILSIDGGGIRGVYPAHILKRMEDKELHINLFDTFDMIAGTSTGSIIAAGVATKIPASNILTMYKKHGVEIFCKKRSFSIPGLCNSIYNSKPLEAILEKTFKDKKLGEITKPLLLPATDIGNGSVHVLKSSYSPDFIRDNDVSVKDAVLASCSAPIYYDPHRLTEYLLADGGLWANNPSLAAVIDAQRRLKVSQNDIQLLSIGTGHSRTMYGTDASRKWGVANGWRGRELINFFLSLQSQSAHNYVSLMLRPEQVMRIDFDSDRSLPLDDTSIMEDLISKADQKFTHQSEAIKKFLTKRGVDHE